MCRAGGPRCDSSSRKIGKSKAATAEAPAAKPATSGSVPSREAADRLAAALPADRTGWDGAPLNERDRRFFALRESGDSGPIDQDGYPDTASEGAGILRDTAKRRGEAVNW